MIKITSLSEFRNAIAGKDEIREAQIGTCETSFCYMIAAENTFDSPEARECRGIVFNHFRDVVVGRPLQKFFNVGERESTRVENIDWSKVIRVMDKRDGCLDGTTRLLTTDGEKTIREIVETKYRGLVLGEEDGQIVVTPIIGHSEKSNDDKEWYEIKTLCGATIKLTGNHMVFSKTRNAYVRTDNLTVEDEIVLVDELLSVI